MSIFNSDVGFFCRLWREVCRSGWSFMDVASFLKLRKTEKLLFLETPFFLWSQFLLYDSLNFYCLFACAMIRLLYINIYMKQTLQFRFLHCVTLLHTYRAVFYPPPIMRPLSSPYILELLPFPRLFYLITASFRLLPRKLLRKKQTFLGPIEVPFL